MAAYDLSGKPKAMPEKVRARKARKATAVQEDEPQGQAVKTVPKPPKFGQGQQVGAGSAHLDPL